MELKKIKYPLNEEFYHFGQSEGSVKIKDNEIEEWINECVKSVKSQLEDGIGSPYSYVASGDTIVICFFSADVQDDIFDDSNYFTVIVARDYESADLSIGDLKKTQMDSIEEMILKEILNSTKENNSKYDISTYNFGDYEVTVKKKTNSGDDI
jgi:hypothetical protein